MITLSDKFQSDIQTNTYSIVPLIVIDEENNPIYISTQRQSFSYKKDIITIPPTTGGGSPVIIEGTIFWEDYDLKISNIQESINLDTRQFKTSTVSFSLTNYVIDGERISDVVSKQSLINKHVSIYYKSQSCTSIDDCALVYKGIIKTIKHNSKTIDFKLEDFTENKLEMEIPVSNLGYSKNIYSPKYLGKEIPIHYGYVNRAPSVLWVDNDDMIQEGIIHVITDDVMDSDRNINVGSCAGHDDRFKGFSENSSQINPLNIFKGDYFTVLKNYSNAGVDNDADWSWQNPSQYINSGNSLKISKIYSSAIPQNAPAYNELQAYIIRRPTHMINSGNDPDSPTLNVTVPIGSPNAAFDDPNYLPSMDNANYVFDENMYTTFAEIPDSTDETDESSYVTNFSPHDWNPAILSPNGGQRQGCFCPIISTGLDSDWDGHGNFIPSLWGDLYTTASYKVFTHLNFHMDKFNGDEDFPVAVYIQLPTIKDMVLRANRRLIEQFYSDDVWEGSDEDYPFMIIELSSLVNRVEAYPLMCENSLADWLAQSGIDPADDPTGNNFGAGYGFSVHPEVGDTEYEEESIWREAYNYFHEDDSHPAVPATGGAYNPEFVNNQIGAIQYPQPTCVRYMIKEEYVSTIEANFIYMSQKTDAMSEAALSTLTGDNPTWGVSIFYNILNTEDGTQFLFDPDTELAQYTPINVSRRFRPHTDTQNTWAEGENNAGEQYYWNQVIEYNCKWNEVMPNQLTGHTDADSDYGISDTSGADPFFSAWGVFREGIGHVTGHGTGNACSEELSQGQMFRTGHPDRCWAIWVKHQIIGTDEEELMGDSFVEHNQTTQNNPSLKIPANTLLPCYHLGNDMEWHNRYETYNDDSNANYVWNTPWAREFGSTGNLLPEIDNFVTISDASTTTSETRVTLVFPLADLEIEDEIKSSTWFTGRILLEFEGDMSGMVGNLSTGGSFNLNVLAAEVEENVIDWETIFGDDENYTHELMNVNAEEYLGYGALEYMWSTSNLDTEETLEDAGFIKNENPDGICKRIGIDAWDEANKFNAFALEYKAVDGNENPIAADVQRANIRSEIYHSNILQVIVFEKALEANFYVNRSGRVNNVEDYAEDLGNGLFKLKYVDVDVDPTLTEIYPLIKEPQDILYHFIEKELSLIDLMDTNSLQEARGYYDGVDYGFSINKKTTAKKFINDFSKSTCMLPIFKSTSEFKLNLIKDEYSQSDSIITVQDIINYSFSRTSIGKINTIVNVRYNYDYAKEIYLAETGYVDGYDMFGNGDGTALNPPRENGYSYEYLGIDREDKVLEFQSKYIRNEDTALKLRNFLYAWSCNQHNEFQLNLPNKYAMLEAGDIIEFDSLIDNMKAYGEDYTVPNTRNGQAIFPYFMINSVSKKPKGK